MQKKEIISQIEAILEENEQLKARNKELEKLVSRQQEIMNNSSIVIRSYRKDVEQMKKKLVERREKIDDLRRQINPDSQKELEELLEISDSINQEYKMQIDSLKSEIEELKQTNQQLQGKLQSKEIMYNSFKEKNSISIIVEGREEDLYPGEQKDIIIGYIKDKFANLEPNMRQYQVCKSILEANPETGTRENIRRSLFEILKTAPSLNLQTLNRKLSIIDIEILETDTCHYKISFKKDPRYNSSISKTPSDGRSGMNMASEFAKILL